MSDKKKPNRIRNKPITFRMTEGEYEALKNKIEESGQPQQEYIIEACLTGQITSADVITEMQNKNRILSDMDRQLRGMGTNLNQMAHVANFKFGKLPMAEDLLKIAGEVTDMKGKVDEVWLSTRQSIEQLKHTER